LFPGAASRGSAGQGRAAVWAELDLLPQARDIGCGRPGMWTAPRLREGWQALARQYDRVVSRNALRLVALVAGAILTFGVTAGTVAIQRRVLMAAPVDCEATRDSPSGSCYLRLPVGGWPFAFLYDNPGTSIRGQLGLEDDFEPGWFLADAAIFGALPAVGAVVYRMRRRRSESPRS
jgi:hypothetical protein